MTEETLPIGQGVAIPLNEIGFRFSRASGPGGQNVNRTASRVELLFDLAGSPSLPEPTRQRALRRLARYLDSSGVLHLVAESTPSQWRNRQEALDRFQRLVAQAIQPPKRRVVTRPTRSSRERRLRSKRQRGQTKQLRQKPRIEE